MSETFTLNEEERAELFQQDPQTANDGGFQNFLIHLQKQYRPWPMKIDLDEDDIDRIRKYAADSKHGGWQKRILNIFGRVLDLKAQ